MVTTGLGQKRCDTTDCQVGDGLLNAPSLYVGGYLFNNGGKFVIIHSTQYSNNG